VLAIFERIAVAEAKIHGVTVETVSFHEVGAVDSIANIVGACIALEELGTPRVMVSPLREGRGWIDCAHGRFPLPAPATLEILHGIEIEQVDELWESIRPTGAAIARELAESFGALPRMEIERVGYGIGTRDLKERPNVLCAVLGHTEPSAPNDFETDTIIEIETKLNDLSRELTGAALERLLALGALDVSLTPVQMKKNRPGVQMSVLCEPALEQKIVHALLTETSAFGVRRSEKRRYKLERRFEKVPTPIREIPVKLGCSAGEVVQVAPEFESCRVASERTQQPLRLIYQVALTAYEQRVVSREPLSPRSVTLAARPAGSALQPACPSTGVINPGDSCA
jgi:pyridinium-3,5-bisthiocarboxylic acid mononucleotide nickel chelatase